MGNSASGGHGRHKFSHKADAEEAARRSRLGLTPPALQPRRSSDPDADKAKSSILIESPREVPDEVLSRLLDGYQSDRLNAQMRQMNLMPAPSVSSTFAPPSSPMLAGLLRDQRSASCQAITTVPPASSRRMLQCMFKWAGGGRKVYLTGAFTDPPWQVRLPMHRSKSANFYTIQDLPVGLHDYCFLVDGQWRVDINQPLHPGKEGHAGAGSGAQKETRPPQTNCLEVKETDFEVFNALEADFAAAGVQKQQKVAEAKKSHAAKSPGPSKSASRSSFGRPGSPEGEYTQEVPSPARLMLEASDHPPLLPPVLLDGILNADTSAHYDPNLMPIPQHVMLNHLYCLSIKDGMMILAATARYRKKFVSTVFYRPIEPEEQTR